MMASSGAALADGPGHSLKDAPAPAPFSWTGFYVGGTIGAGRGLSNTTTSFTNLPPNPIDPFSVQGANSNSLMVGLHAGYNHQVNRNWVVGVEVDYSGSDASATSVRRQATVNGVPFPNDFISASSKTNSLFSAAMDRWMAYGTVGGAWSKVSLNGNELQPGMASFQTTNSNDGASGLAVGGGIEFAVSNNIILRTEYLYYGSERPIRGLHRASVVPD
jgi:outer membrane immunogenic protein